MRLKIPKAWAVAGCVLAAVFSVPLPARGDVLIVANKGEDTVSFIDLASGTERARVPTGKAPHEVALSPDGTKAAVVAYGGTSIDVFDVRTARLLRRIELSPHAGPHGIIWPERRRIVAVAERSKSLVLIDPERGVRRSAGTGNTGSHMAVLSPDRRRAYVSNIMSGTVSIFDLNRMEKIGDIVVGGYPEGLTITPDGRQLWVGDDSGPRVRVVDIASQKVIDTLVTESVAIRLLVTSDGKSIVISNMASGSLSVFDIATRRMIRTIPVSGSRTAMQVTIAPSRDGQRLYVAETANSTVAEVDLLKGAVLRRISVGKNGDGLAVTP